MPSGKEFIDISTKKLILIQEYKVEKIACTFSFKNMLLQKACGQKHHDGSLHLAVRSLLHWLLPQVTQLMGLVVPLWEAVSLPRQHNKSYPVLCVHISMNSPRKISDVIYSYHRGISETNTEQSDGHRSSLNKWCTGDIQGPRVYNFIEKEESKSKSNDTINKTNVKRRQTLRHPRSINPNMINHVPQQSPLIL